jgi:hypothetical protein
MSQCRSCHAPVFWVLTETGKRMPLDADPVSGGKMILYDNNTRARVAKNGEPGPRYMPHFATCPQVDDWRPKSRHRYE